jgi:hypothetical protein
VDVRRLLMPAFALLVFSAPVRAAELPGGGPVPLLYLHPLVNYGFDPEWTRAWERGLQAHSSLRVNVGSVSTDDFLTDVELHLTEPISKRFRVLYDLRWFDALHVDPRDTEHFLGFELAAASWLGLQGQAHPAPDKEELDLRFGVLLHDASREQYARVLVRWDDPLFDDKNDLGAMQGRTATSLEWAARGRWRGVEAFTEGSYGSGSERSYPDSMKVPEPAAESRDLNGSVTRLRGLFAPGRFVELELLHHEFESSVTSRVASSAETYRNRLFDFVLRGVWRLDAAWRLRGEIHRLDQEASAPSFQYAREDWMPALWVRRAFGPVHSIEVGYMGTRYDWTGSPGDPAAENGYKQKLELAWLIEPSDRARVQFSLSHEPDPQKFGGANVQVQVGF